MIELDPEVSLCSSCARHKELKSCIEEDCISGLCAVCGNQNAKVRNIQRIGPLVSLFRALIRFHWSEGDYNPHWGGDGLLGLFERVDNPLLVGPPKDEYADSFVELIEDNPYPDYDEGVCLYAGSDENGSRMMLTSISTTTPYELREMQRALSKKNFFEVEPDLDETIDAFLVDISRKVAGGSVWFRARIGIDSDYYSDDGEFRVIPKPYLGDKIAAPPPPLVSGGRLNRPGVSFFYLATNVETALAEVRPHPGHRVSIGGFRVVGDIKVADFDLPIGPFSSCDSRLDQFALIYALNEMMSSPIIPEERGKYQITQLLAEVLMKRGFEGIRFRSSVADGVNLCVFDSKKVIFEPGLSSVRRVAKVDYMSDDVECLLEASEFQRSV